MPQWTVALSVELAHRQGDTDRQAAMLEELVSRGGSSVKPRMYLVQALIELGRGSDALKHLEVLLAEPTISPQERMQAGLFLLNLGHADRAIATAFQAYRDSPNVGPWRTSWPQSRGKPTIALISCRMCIASVSGLAETSRLRTGVASGHRLLEGRSHRGQAAGSYSTSIAWR